MTAYLNNLRLTVAQFPSWYYYLSAAIYLITYVAVYFGLIEVNLVEGSGRTPLGYNYFNYAVVSGILLFIVLSSCLTISWHWLGKLYQQEDRAESFYGLPLSPYGRIALVATVLLLLVPALVLIPVLLLQGMLSISEPFGLLVADLSDLFSFIMSGVVIYYATTLIWLFPRLGVPRFSGTVSLVVLALVVAALIYGAEQGGVTEFYLPATVLDDPDVLGLNSRVSRPGEEAHLRLEDVKDFPTLPAVLLFLLTAASACLAIFKKQV